jgi:hypothetical protein
LNFFSFYDVLYFFLLNDAFHVNCWSLPLSIVLLPTKSLKERLFMSYALPLTIVVVALISVMLAPRAKAASGFFAGVSPSGAQPSLFTLILSQVTTWIFARSLLNAAILGLCGILLIVSNGWGDY